MKEEKYREVVEWAGFEFVGIQSNPFGKDLVLFNDVTGSTLAIDADDVVSPDDVREVVVRREKNLKILYEGGKKCYK